MASYMLHSTGTYDRDFIRGSFHDVVRIAARIVITRSTYGDTITEYKIPEYTLRDSSNKIMRRFTMANVHKLAKVNR